ncbi:zinc-binding dehydrogenase [Beijerinckia indica]|uniref:Alcohol dehydrogenase GroES domain protein n=1 Tax=Beijerinckia indica subsp. indica (strain ATCC 9039 / DSM 1715 / NCIMB 8712) TaxID=395963 RepID=B2IKY8_BEII9|nr:zinc-binding dehydrogenase [Beijerinckia indica]ACB96528.1 Alcohol dehydrogenase GroES domain protein [Beijerinckia indica subsp. indica ATCC 9039]
MIQSLPEKHQVWAWPDKGEPQSLRLEIRTRPIPTPGEVLVANSAIGLNPVDWKMIEWGHAAWSAGHVPGVDGVGVIAATGDGVRLPIGLRGAYHQSLARDGSFAEFTIIDARSILPIPASVADVVAAALPCPGLTAWQALRKVPRRMVRDVLVTGAGGSVGSILAQLAARCGWRVWVTAASAHRDKLLALGITGVFDYRDPNWCDRLVESLGPRRLYAIFDTVSGEHAQTLAPMLGYNGHLICIQDRIEENPLPAFTTAVSLHEVALNSVHLNATDEDWQEWRFAGAELFQMLETGALQLPPIEVRSFDALPLTLTDLKSRAHKGKLVVVT